MVWTTSCINQMLCVSPPPTPIGNSKSEVNCVTLTRSRRQQFIGTVKSSHKHTTDHSYCGEVSVLVQVYSKKVPGDEHGFPFQMKFQSTWAKQAEIIWPRQLKVWTTVIPWCSNWGIHRQKKSPVILENQKENPGCHSKYVWKIPSLNPSPYNSQKW